MSRELHLFWLGSRLPLFTALPRRVPLGKRASAKYYSRKPLGLERARKRNPSATAWATAWAEVRSVRTSSAPPPVTPPQTAQIPLLGRCSCSLLSCKRHQPLAVHLQKRTQPQVAASSARGRASLATALAHLNGVATDQARS